MSVELTSYASGDGALAFSHVEDRFDRNEGCFSSIATGDHITRQDVEKYVAEAGLQEYLIVAMGEPREMKTTKMVETWPKGKTFKSSGKPRKPVMVEQQVKVTIPPVFRLCAPVFRVGRNKVRLGERIYKYSVDEDNIFWTRDGEYTASNMTVTVDDDGEESAVKNLSTLGAIRWFLNNEKRIVQQYPDQDETTAETVQQLQEAIQTLQRSGMSEEDILKLGDFKQLSNFEKH